jgi:hypothetical protein
MQFRWWNSFNLLGIILVVLGLVGALSRGHFVFDPGRAVSGYEWLIYLVAGVLMLINGSLPPAIVHTSQENDKR